MLRNLHQHVRMDAISVMTGLGKLLMTATCLPVLSLLFTIQLGSEAESSTIKDEMTQERGRLEQLKRKSPKPRRKPPKQKKARVRSKKH